MSYIIELSIFSLLLFIDNQFIRAFNESCGADKPPCSNPLKCSNGYCLCSVIGKTTDKNNLLAFWTGDQCMTCPVDYTTTGTKCYKLISGKDNQMSWNQASKRCQESNGDLLILRSETEYTLMTGIIRSTIKMNEMFQRTPRTGTYFASLWLGAKLTDWRGGGTFNLVSHGPPVTKTSYYWCPQNSFLGQEPTYIGLKATGERQGCVGLAFFSDNSVCMHNWFCSWDTYTLCEIHPPPQANIGVEALEGKANNTLFYIGIFGIILVLLLASIGIYFMCFKKKNVSRTRSFDSAESDMSQDTIN